MAATLTRPRPSTANVAVGDYLTNGTDLFWVAAVTKAGRGHPSLVLLEDSYEPESLKWTDNAVLSELHRVER